MAKTQDNDQNLLLASQAVYADIASHREVLVTHGLQGLDVNSEGYLNPGIYNLPWGEFVIAYGFNARRLELISGLEAIAKILCECGCRQLFVGGSFITSKSMPNDFDGCYSLDGVDRARLTSIEPDLLVPDEHSLSSLSRKYGGAMEPIRAIPGINASMLEILQYDARDKIRKGIVFIDLAVFSSC